ncbi:FapA family protein [Curvibacter sp. APW13]|uniref:DUF342 domain-containing protein n=1 Tax=Curvibacter sp. APW13 TaxID=3077236 RepID=UPI0028E0878E|nr:FapA family protein [Curvibacter sp. APW13]MDT8992686.1 FapA family protein [Curvibacter sp. APW13]
MMFPGLSLTEADGQVFLRGLPDAARAPVTAESLRAWLDQSGFAGCDVMPDALAAAVEDCNARSSPFVVHIAQRRDAQVLVTVAPDAMQAWISITAPQGGRLADEGVVMQALREQGVAAGVDGDAVRAACAAQPVEHHLVAQGVPAQDGLDARFEEVGIAAADRSPRLTPDGMIDYREHGAILLVAPGQPLMRRHPATPGIAGFTVRAAELQPKPGKDLPFTDGLRGAAVSASDPNLLQAHAAGLPVRVPCGVHVEPVLEVEEVNLATGNLHFDGTVRVKGDVIQGMKVQATGDVEVGGVVEGSQLDAGGHVIVKGGIIAGAFARAAGTVAARFIESSTVDAGTLIAVDDMVLESTLVSRDQIHIGIKVPQRGKLVGGSTQAGKWIRVPYLGSSKGGVTQVAVGVNPELELRYQALLARMEQEKENETKLDKLAQQLGAMGDPKGMLPKVKAAWQAAVKQWGASLAERTELDALLKQARTARLELTKGTVGEVALQLGPMKVQLRREYGAGTFGVDPNGTPIFTDPAGKAIPLTP